MLGGAFSPALFAPSLLALLPAPLLLVAVGLPSVAPPDLALLPLDGLGAVVSAKLRLQHHHTRPDGVTLPTGLVTL